MRKEVRKWNARKTRTAWSQSGSGGGDIPETCVATRVCRLASDVYAVRDDRYVSCEHIVVAYAPTEANKAVEPKHTYFWEKQDNLVNRISRKEKPLHFGEHKYTYRKEGGRTWKVW